MAEGKAYSLAGGRCTDDYLCCVVNSPSETQRKDKSPRPPVGNFVGGFGNRSNGCWDRDDQTSTGADFSLVGSRGSLARRAG